VDFIRVNNAQSELVRQQDGLVASRAAIALGAVQTYRALGGGWEVRQGQEFVDQETISRYGMNINYVDKDSLVIEDEVTLWGQVGVPSNIRIGKGAVVLGQSGVGHNLEGGKTYFGSPCDESRKKYRELALIRKLPSFFDTKG
jgi:acetyltransferase-like isoleucine patch superfamily enzyme